MKTLQDKFELLTDQTSKKNIFHILACLEEVGARAFLVGGCVRDILIGAQPKDYDIEVYDLAEDDFHTTMTGLGAVGVGKSFFVYKYANIDISLPRSEKKIGSGHGGFEVSIEQDMKQACSRRDFTMNAMLLGLQDFELYDFFGGMADMESKTIRLIDEQKFKEDSLRVLRAMRFAAQLGFKVENTTVATCEAITLSDLSKERIYMEFEKLFTSKFLTHGLYFAIRLGIMQKIFGLGFDKKQFFACVKLIKNAQKIRVNALEGLFLFVLAQVFRMSLVKLCSKLAIPNALARSIALQTKIPKAMTERFLVGIGTKMAISQWLGVRDNQIKERAKALGVWDNKFCPSVTSSDALKIGLEGKEVGIYLRRQQAIEIKNKYSKEKI